MKPMRQNNSRTLEISPRFLLSIYLVLPLGLSIVALDVLALGSSIRLSGPSDPHEYLWFTVLFTLPHIIASFFGFFDKEYIDTYGPRLLSSARYIAVLVIGLSFISANLVFLIFALYTMTHVFLQQAGIAKSLMQGSNSWHKPWQWLGVILSFALYINVYADFIKIDGRFFTAFLALVSVLFIAAGSRAVMASKTSIGQQYFWATTLTPLVSWLFLAIGYPLLIIAVPRVIHDLTAYAFYVAHDHNRFVNSRSNYIYKFGRSLGLPVAATCLGLSLALAYPFQAGGLGQAAYPILMAVTIMHYYIEGFMWKREGLHRRYISYSIAP